MIDEAQYQLEVYFFGVLLFSCWNKFLFWFEHGPVMSIKVQEMNLQLVINPAPIQRSQLLPDSLANKRGSATNALTPFLLGRIHKGLLGSHIPQNQFWLHNFTVLFHYNFLTRYNTLYLHAPKSWRMASLICYMDLVALSCPRTSYIFLVSEWLNMLPWMKTRSTKTWM